MRLLYLHSEWVPFTKVAILGSHVSTAAVNRKTSASLPPFSLLLNTEDGTACYGHCTFNADNTFLW